MRRRLLRAALAAVLVTVSGLAADAALADEPASSELPAALIVEQGGPGAAEPPGQVKEVVLRWEENPTQAAGGQDDAQRAAERAADQSQDDGEKRRK